MSTATKVAIVILFVAELAGLAYISHHEGWKNGFQEGFQEGLCQAQPENPRC